MPRLYETPWARVVSDFKNNSKTVFEELSAAQAKTTAKALRKEKLRDEENWKISNFYELYADYDTETFELTVELRPRRGKNMDTEHLRRVL